MLGAHTEALSMSAPRGTVRDELKLLHVLDSRVRDTLLPTHTRLMDYSYTETYIQYRVA